MPIDKFMAMLNDGALYFPNITSFKDKYEGGLSYYSRSIVHSEDLFNEKNTPIKQDKPFFENKKEFDEASKFLLADLFKESGMFFYHKHSFEALLSEFSNHLMFCNSWFMKPTESHSMWTEYGGKSPTSIAIQTTLEDLINSLDIDGNEYCIHIGKVNYIDYKEEHIKGYENFTEKDLTDPNDVLELFYAPVMHKRQIYNDEHEVRAVISFESVCKKYTDRVYTSEIPFYSDRLFRRDMHLDDYITDPDDSITKYMKNIPTKGIPVEANLNKLIKKVIMSPEYNTYFYHSFIKVIECFGLNPDIVYISDI